MAATVFILYCVGSNWLSSGYGLTKLMQSQLAMFGMFNEFCCNFLMLFVALKLHSHSPVGCDVVETTLLSDFKS
jgi:hypothetical protein